MGQAHAGEHVQPDHFELWAEVGLGEVAFDAETGVVDQQLEARQPGQPAGHPLDIGLDGQIGGDRFDGDGVALPKLARQRVQPVGAAGNQHERVALVASFRRTPRRSRSTCQR